MATRAYFDHCAPETWVKTDFSSALISSELLLRLSFIIMYLRASFGPVRHAIVNLDLAGPCARCLAFGGLFRDKI
jgi:hypothetical protein